MRAIKVVIFLIGFVLFGAGLTWMQASAQRERPLAERALHQTDWAPSIVLTQGAFTIKEEAQPLNSVNGLRIHKFQSGYSFTGTADKLQFAHYLYRFQNARDAQEQAQRVIDSANSEKARPLAPEISLDALLAKDDSGTTIRVTDPETGGYYYWYVATRGRDLSLLMIGGAPNAQTLAQFNQYKNIVSHR